MKCKLCGADIQETDRFCGICGTPNQPTEPPQDDIDSILGEFTKADTVSDSDSDNADFIFSEETEEKAEYDTAEQTAVPDSQPTGEAPDGSFSLNGGAAPGFFPPPIPNNQRYNAEPEREKKVVSLAVAVVCIVAVFILSIACGILAQLYIEKEGGGSARKSGVTSSMALSVDRAQSILGGSENG